MADWAHCITFFEVMFAVSSMTLIFQLQGSEEERLGVPGRPTVLLSPIVHQLW